MATATEVVVEHASDTDLINAIRTAEKQAGFSFDELERLAILDDFPNLISRSAWHAISGLRDLAA